MPAGQFRLTQDHTLIPSSNVQDVTLVVLQASSDTE